jgi:hypothetical protein
MLHCAGEGICGVDDGGEREEGDGTADPRVRDRSHEAQHNSSRSVCNTHFCLSSLFMCIYNFFVVNFSLFLLKIQTSLIWKRKLPLFVVN